MSDFRDPKSVAGKQLPVAETTQLLVIGAGPAGIAAAAEAVKHGIKVVLADENPVPVAAMGDDIPLHFGQRYGAAARNRTAMLEAFIARDPAIAALFDAGVDVRLGTSVWGLYANGPSVGWLPGPVAGLHDGERSFMLGCERVIVAAGRRDMGLAFPGWELPGVLGITAAERLLLRFDVLDVRRVVGTRHFDRGAGCCAFVARRRDQGRCLGRGRPRAGWANGTSARVGGHPDTLRP